MAHGLSCSTACGIFLNQGWNPSLLHWQANFLPLSHQGSPIYFYTILLYILEYKKSFTLQFSEVYLLAIVYVDPYIFVGLSSLLSPISAPQPSSHLNGKILTPSAVVNGIRASRVCLVCLVTQLCLILYDCMDSSPPGSSVHRDSPAKNTRVGYYALLQGIFPTHGLNPGLSHYRWILYHLNHQGRPRILAWVAYPFSRESSQPRNQSGVSCIAGGFFTS